MKLLSSDPMISVVSEPARVRTMSTTKTSDHARGEARAARANETGSRICLHRRVFTPNSRLTNPAQSHIRRLGARVLGFHYSAPQARIQDSPEMNAISSLGQLANRHASLASPLVVSGCGSTNTQINRQQSDAHINHACHIPQAKVPIKAKVAKVPAAKGWADAGSKVICTRTIAPAIASRIAPSAPSSNQACKYILCA